MIKAKVFCIGFHKTGTTSLKFAMNKMGYRVAGPNGVRDENIASNVFDMVSGLVPKFDAFQDNPYPVIYQYLDESYPDSKFILTRRDDESWLNSVVRHFAKIDSPMRRWIYGVGYPIGNEQIYLARYQQHNHDVKEYFVDRPGDLLVMDIANGDGWEQLCDFLGEDVPRVPFPHRNRNNLKGTEKLKTVEGKTSTPSSSRG